MIRTVIEFIALLVLLYIATGIRLMPRITRGIIMKELKTVNEQLTRIRALVLAQTSVVAGAVALLTSVKDQIRTNADDPDALRELADSIESNTASLAQATAIGTASSDEVHADDGGDGTDETVVDAAGALEPPVDEPAADAAAAGAGEGAQQQDGQGGEQQAE